MKIKKMLGCTMVVLGVLFLGMAIYIMQDNMQVEKQAQDFSMSALGRLEAEMNAAVAAQPPEENEEVDLTQAASQQDLEGVMGEVPTEILVDGYLYAGILVVPSVNLYLPVQSTWSYLKLNDTPCVYQGDLANEDLIIAGHNYVAHFSKIAKLIEGDLVYWRSADGIIHEFAVSAVDTVDDTDVEGLESGDWDMTLFTCNTDSSKRIAVRLQPI